METIVSGIRPTGHLHLGNYFGAVQNFLQLQNEHKCYFFIADYHSLTTHPDSINLKQRVRNVIVEYLAIGLDPDKAVLYVQSDVEEVAELYLLLNMFAYKGELERTTSFKEKARQQADNINAGLLTYPVLMAADVLLHKATKVPVGKDQEQHLEMMRNFAMRFNRFYQTDFFPEPMAYNFGKPLVKVPGLDGSGKMGKSDDNGIFLFDDEKSIRKRIMRAVTDAGPTQMNQEIAEPIKNLFTLLDLVSTPDTVQFFVDKYHSMEIRYSDLKKQLADDVVNFITPIKEKIDALKTNTKYINNVLKEGSEKAKISAKETVRQVREIIGFLN